MPHRQRPGGSIATSARPLRATMSATHNCRATECLIDLFSYGPLPFNGTINQPHPATLSAGYHSFSIRQQVGAFFFISLNV